MRSKEESHDYRYFPDPDLPPLVIAAEEIDAARRALPELPHARRDRFERELGLPAYDADVLSASRALADYFEGVARAAGDAKQASNWVMGPVLAAAKERGREIEELPLPASALAELIGLVRDGTISQNVGKDVLRKMLDGGAGPREIVASEGLAQVRDEGQLEGWVDDALAAFPDEVARFRGGERKLQGFFMGEVMKRSRGKADPGEVARLLARKLAP
jgi:aspartyl-tRNA(Asn)/glutamyl-tRNA(Gln) amidotransferase subunit B